ncbi:MAG: energy transducer TonB [Ignavibacteriae bacterium]|nr:energy transducer TonB [Ignavibacteriota bacterium]NOG97995.1 energy transducer TonB [Ignavibacteriota bacterium]
MKRHINIAFLIVLVLSWACAHGINTYEDITPPVVKEQSQLIFPKIAQENELEGTTKLVILITEEGHVFKVSTVKSSGYQILDEAAEDYCRNLIFIPAHRGDTPVSSRMEWVVKFDFEEKSWQANRYINEVNILYSQIAEVKNVEKTKLLKALLNKHSEFILNMQNSISLNFYASQVISPEVNAGWSELKNTYPLTFLLYHDFIYRNPKYFYLSEVKTELEKSLKNDYKFILNSNPADEDDKYMKENLLLKIKTFVQEYYKDIDVKSLGNENSTKQFS